jgi:ATP-dependent RNA helicase DDX21
MMATDIICPDSYMKDPEPEQPKKPEEHIDYFIKNPGMIEVLHKKNIKYFFPIQYMTYETIYNCQDLIGRDRTGSGKTIAYSLPIIERFRHQELFKSNYIKFLIILPTRELCIQVTN